LVISAAFPHQPSDTKRRGGTTRRWPRCCAPPCWITVARAFSARRS